MLLPQFLKILEQEPSIRADFVFARVIEMVGGETFNGAIKSLSADDSDEFDKMCGRYGMTILVGELTGF